MLQFGDCSTVRNHWGKNNLKLYAAVKNVFILGSFAPSKRKLSHSACQIVSMQQNSLSAFHRQPS